jgi:large subunit ribosomal protein L47
MKAIKFALTERYYAWEDAVKLAKIDPEVDLSGNGPAYTPSEYLVEEDEATLAAQEDVASSSTEDGPRTATSIDPATLPSEEQAPKQDSRRI